MWASLAWVGVAGLGVAVPSTQGSSGTVAADVCTALVPIDGVAASDDHRRDGGEAQGHGPAGSPREARQRGPEGCLDRRPADPGDRDRERDQPGVHRGVGLDPDRDRDEDEERPVDEIEGVADPADEPERRHAQQPAGREPAAAVAGDARGEQRGRTDARHDGRDARIGEARVERQHGDTDRAKAEPTDEPRGPAQDPANGAEPTATSPPRPSCQARVGRE